MTPQKKQAVEAKIRELVPSTMELSFGCRLKFDGDVFRITHHFPAQDERGPVYHADHPVKIGLTIKHNELENVEILGHEIQPHHVLMALLRSPGKPERWITIDVQGQIIDFTGEETGIFWNLPFPLSDQPDPVWELLYSVLIKE